MCHEVVILSPVGLLFCVDVPKFDSDRATPYSFSVLLFLVFFLTESRYKWETATKQTLISRFLLANNCVVVVGISLEKAVE